MCVVLSGFGSLDLRCLVEQVRGFRLIRCLLLSRVRCLLAIRIDRLNADLPDLQFLAYLRIQAREDLRVQNARYRAGISTMLDVLTSQLTLVQAGYGLAEARNQYHTTRAALEALVGRAL